MIFFLWDAYIHSHSFNICHLSPNVLVWERRFDMSEERRERSWEEKDKWSVDSSTEESFPISICIQFLVCPKLWQTSECSSLNDMWIFSLLHTLLSVKKINLYGNFKFRMYCTCRFSYFMFTTVIILFMSVSKWNVLCVRNWN